MILSSVSNCSICNCHAEICLQHVVDTEIIPFDDIYNTLKPDFEIFNKHPNTEVQTYAYVPRIDPGPFF